MMGKSTGNNLLQRIMLGTLVVSGMTAMTTANAKEGFNFFLTEAVTPLAHEAEGVHVEFFTIITVLFFVALGFIIYAIVNHRKSKGGQPASFSMPATRLQWLWFTLPFIGLFILDYVVMGIPAYKAAIAMEDTKTNADMVLKVTGSQWKWQYEYPAEGIKFVSTMSTPREQIDGKEAKGENYLVEVDNPVVLPINKKVRILLMSSDVIHSWNVPAFGGKKAAIPGFLREMWVQIEEPGTYRGQCAQICGKGHPFMPIVVKGVSEDKYKEWVALKQVESAKLAASTGTVWRMEDLMKHGQGIYEKICSACHQPDGKGLPGVFPALAGSRVVNSQFLDESGHLIKDRHLDRVMNGKAGTAMQAFKNTLSDVDIAAIVTYERNSFGNHMGDMVQPSQVKALR